MITSAQSRSPRGLHWILNCPEATYTDAQLAVPKPKFLRAAPFIEPSKVEFKNASAVSRLQLQCFCLPSVKDLEKGPRYRSDRQPEIRQFGSYLSIWAWAFELKPGRELWAEDLGLRAERGWCVDGSTSLIHGLESVVSLSRADIRFQGCS